MIAYPAWPMLSGATKGVLGYSTRIEVADDIATHESKNASLVAALNSVDLETLGSGEDLHRYAVARGGSVFRAQCSQCHGSGAAGALGYPNLLDDDWLWGGGIAEIAYSINHGIRNETDFDARFSQMPAFGEFLTADEINAVAEFVFGLSSAETDPALVETGAILFADNCASCHADEGTGIRELGAPNLADAIWLYGGDREALKTSISEARYGVMPAWGQRLSEEDLRAVSIYVHSLGGGE
jgi:cytochrome c oxidase cbb3-type subunit 3